MPDSRRLPSPPVPVASPDRPAVGGAEGVQPDTLLRAIAEASGDAIFAKDRDGRLTFANAGTLALMGKPLAQVLGRTDLELLADREAARRVMANDRRIMDSGEGEELEELVPMPDGRPVVWLSRKFPFRDASGRVIGLLGLSRDITPLKETEAALRWSEEELRRVNGRLQAVVDANVVGIVIADAGAHVLEANRYFLDVLGLTAEEARAGIEWRAFTPAEHLPSDERALAQLRERGVCDPYEKEYLRRDGTRRWVLIQNALTPGPAPLLITCVVDITTRRRAEARLRDAHARLRTFVDAGLVGILFGDVDGRVYDCNEELSRIIGRTREEVLAGKVRWTDITPPEDLPLDVRAIEEARATGRCQPYEKRYVRPDGAEVAVQVGYVLYDAQRTKSVAFVLDISARRAQERRVAELVEALTRSNAELDQFAYVASHDLKAPLRGIANLSEWLEEDLGAAVTPDAREKLVLLRGRVQRLEGLINGILQYSRAGRSSEREEAVDVGALVGEVVELLPRPAGARVEVSADLPTLVTERVPLQQVFMNLVGNAFKHASREAPRVTVAAHDRGPFWEFEVSDDGQGIAPQYHDRIWGLFQTLEARDKVEGTGIGLSVVRKIVERRGGRAWVESAEGRGATFRFTWPRHG